MKPIFLDSDDEVCSSSYSRSQPSTINNTEAKFFSIALDIVIKMLLYLKYAFKQCIVLQTWLKFQLAVCQLKSTNGSHLP